MKLRQSLFKAKVLLYFIQIRKWNEELIFAVILYDKVFFVSLVDLYPFNPEIPSYPVVGVNDIISGFYIDKIIYRRYLGGLRLASAYSLPGYSSYREYYSNAMILNRIIGYRVNGSYPLDFRVQKFYS